MVRTPSAADRTSMLTKVQLWVPMTALVWSHVPMTDRLAPASTGSVEWATAAVFTQPVSRYTVFGATCSVWVHAESVGLLEVMPRLRPPPCACGLAHERSAEPVLTQPSGLAVGEY